MKIFIYFNCVGNLWQKSQHMEATVPCGQNSDYLYFNHWLNIQILFSITDLTDHVWYLLTICLSFSSFNFFFKTFHFEKIIKFTLHYASDIEWQTIELCMHEIGYYMAVYGRSIDFDRQTKRSNCAQSKLIHGNIW